MATLPQINNQMSNEVKTNSMQLPSKTYKLNNNVLTTYEEDGQLKNIEADRIKGYTDGLEAIQQAIYHILNTERYAYLIYDKNYGVELEQYIGKDINYIKTTIGSTLNEALTHDLRIYSVEVNSVEPSNRDYVLINFTAHTIYGDLVLEVNINV